MIEYYMLPGQTAERKTKQKTIILIINNTEGQKVTG